MAETAVMDCAAGFAADSGQFLTFTLQGEEYGIEILRVQEIKGFSKIRPIPNAPSYIKGVLNLRGTVVPVLDLRARFGMPEAEYNQFTVIIVVSVGSKVVGLVVDAVSDVLNITNDQVEETPEIAGDTDSSFFHGMGKVGEKLVLLLDIDRLIGGEALREIPTDEIA
ncbi:MAG: chemotaxis protein CheW [Thermoguttaceae bacterium]|jgi:purine-binding chemotaxis protein CheW